MTPKIYANGIESVQNFNSLQYYKNFGNHFLTEGKVKKGERQSQLEGREVVNSAGKRIKDTVTLSQPKCEIITLIKKDWKWHLVLGKQPYSSHIVVAFGKLYSKVFLAPVEGVVKEGENFLSSAMQKMKRELGANLIHISELVVPRLYRSVNYTNEMTKLYLAVVDKINPKDSDEEGNPINVCTIPLEEVKTAFMEYIDGVRSDFFGFDIPDITMLSMAILFWKIDKGKIRLNNLKGNLL